MPQRGPAGGRIFALGALAVGDQFECTAVPELRQAARRIAEAIVGRGDTAPILAGLPVGAMPTTSD